MLRESGIAPTALPKGGSWERPNKSKRLRRRQSNSGRFPEPASERAQKNRQAVHRSRAAVECIRRRSIPVRLRQARCVSLFVAPHPTVRQSGLVRYLDRAAILQPLEWTGEIL